MVRNLSYFQKQRKITVERKSLLAACYRECAFVMSYFSTKGMAPYCVPDGPNKCHLSSYFSMVYHLPPSSMGGASELMRLKKQSHINILPSPKWRLLLTSALLAQEFITIRGTGFLLVAEFNLKCMLILGNSIEGPGQRSRYSSSLSAGRFGFKPQWA